MVSYVSLASHVSDFFSLLLFHLNYISGTTHLDGFNFFFLFNFCFRCIFSVHFFLFIYWFYLYIRWPVFSIYLCVCCMQLGIAIRELISFGICSFCSVPFSFVMRNDSSADVATSFLFILFQKIIKNYYGAFGFKNDE